MTIEHKDIPASRAHEPKGADVATDGTVYVFNGNGSGTVKKIGVDSIDQNSFKNANKELMVVQVLFAGTQTVGTGENQNTTTTINVDNENGIAFPSTVKFTNISFYQSTSVTPSVNIAVSIDGTEVVSHDFLGVQGRADFPLVSGPQGSELTYTTSSNNVPMNVTMTIEFEYV